VARQHWPPAPGGVARQRGPPGWVQATSACSLCRAITHGAEKLPCRAASWIRSLAGARTECFRT
jgi:hypothetical protein